MRVAIFAVVKASIVPFGQTDLPFGKLLTDGESWHRTSADWARLFRIEPLGMFKATVDGADAGVAAVTSYGELAWIHSVIVAPQYRGRGVGRLLMDSCVDYSERNGARCFKLDAVPAAKLFYEGLGFTAEHESLRFVRKGEHGSALVQRMRHEDLRNVIPFDHLMTRIDRKKVLEELYADNPEWAFLARDNHGVRGYLFGRPSDAWISLGPCVCVPGDERWFVKLVRSAMCTAPEKTYRMCVSATNHKSLIALKGMKFEESQASTRMFMGKKMAEADANFAMISPEKG